MNGQTDEQGKPAEASQSGGLREQAERVRTSMAWVAGAFGAVALMLIPGLGLADLGALEGLRLAVALVLAVGGFLIAAGTALAVARFVRLGNVCLDDLVRVDGTPRQAELVAYVERNPTLFQGEACSVGALHQTYWSALDDLRRAEQRRRKEAPWVLELTAAPAHDHATAERGGQPDYELAIAKVRVTILEQVIDAVEQSASLHQLRRGFVDRRPALVVAALAVAVAMLGFACFAHPPTSSVSDLSDAHLVDLDLSGTDLRGANLSSTTIEHVNLHEANMQDTKLDGTTWSDTTCPSGDDSDDVGGTCVGHLYVPPPLKPTAAIPGSRPSDGSG